MTYTTTQIKIIGYEITEIEDKYGDWENVTYEVIDSMTKEYLFEIRETPQGWRTAFTRTAYETPQEAVAISREKAIERLERALNMEVFPLNTYGSLEKRFTVRNLESGNHYVVCPDSEDPKTRCECPDALYRGVECKHQKAVRDFQECKTSWKLQAVKTYQRLSDGEQLTINTAAGEAVLNFEIDSRFGISYLRTQRVGAASTKLIMGIEELRKYVFDLYNPRVIEAFGSVNPRFDSQSPTSNPLSWKFAPLGETPRPQFPQSPITFTSPDGFYTWEANLKGETIAIIRYNANTCKYDVFAGNEMIASDLSTLGVAENYVRANYQELSTTEQNYSNCTIEDCDYLTEHGYQYIFRVDGRMVGYIFLSDEVEELWFNGDREAYSTWQECGLALAKITF